MTELHLIFLLHRAHFRISADHVTISSPFDTLDLRQRRIAQEGAQV